MCSPISRQRVSDMNDRYLKSKDVDVVLPNMAFMLPEVLPQNGIFIIDTSDLFAALEGEAGGNRRSLERVCRHLQIGTTHLHNAGNDAHVGWRCSRRNTSLTRWTVHNVVAAIHGLRGSH